MEFLHRIFRANPDYELITPAPMQFSVIRSGDEKKEPIISLNLSEANIFYILREEQHLTSSIAKLSGEDLGCTITALVYDNIIQAQNTKGIFEGGPTCSFVKEFFNSLPIISQPRHFISKLSWDSIEYANYFSHLPLNEIIQKLYSYNTFPRTRFYDQEIFHSCYKDWLGIESNIELSGRLNKTYSTNISSKHPGHWFTWYHKALAPSSNLAYKLYISPNPAELGPVFPIVADICYSAPVPAFKIGSGIGQILRPDKLVLYFSDYDTLETVGLSIRKALRGTRAHGVPYTNSFDNDGLVSWAIEPSPDLNISWRIHVASRIGRLIKLGYMQNSELDVLKFLERLQLEKIQPNNWNMQLS